MTTNSKWFMLFFETHRDIDKEEHIGCLYVLFSLSMSLCVSKKLTQKDFTKPLNNPTH
jgi:hypothetical protein